MVKKKKKTSLAKAEDMVRFQSREDPLEKEIATHTIYLPVKSHGQRSLAGYSLWGGKRVRHSRVTKQQHIQFYFLQLGESY